MVLKLRIKCKYAHSPCWLCRRARGHGAALRARFSEVDCTRVCQGTLSNIYCTRIKYIVSETKRLGRDLTTFHLNRMKIVLAEKENFTTKIMLYSIR